MILFNIFGGNRDLPLLFFSHIPSTEVAHKEKANGGEEELRESDQDEDGVAAAQVEPVAAEQAKVGAARTPQVLSRVRYQRSKPNLSTFLQKVLPPISEIDPNQIFYIQQG